MRVGTDSNTMEFIDLDTGLPIYDAGGGNWQYKTNEGNQNNNPVDNRFKSYYDKYSKAFTDMGLSPSLSENDFYNYAKTWGDAEGGLAGRLERDLYPLVAKQYNDNLKSYYTAQGLTADPSWFISTTYNADTMGDWRGKGADWLVSQIGDLSSKSQNYATSTTEAANQKAEDEKNAYKFEMPTEWQTIEDQANTTLKAGRPEFNPQFVTDWENKLEKSYAPVREKLKTNMANYWASLFPQGGGSGTQAVENMGQLNDFEMNKFNTATGFAESDLAQRLADFTNAQNILSGIGEFKAGAGQFKSQLDAANYWNKVKDVWEKKKYDLDTRREDVLWNKNATLAKYLAEIQRPQQPDFLTSLLPQIAGGLATGGSSALVNYLLKR